MSAGLSQMGQQRPFRGCVRNVRFSNRPFEVKRFQTNHHHCGVDVAHGLVLLFGIGTKALPVWDSKTRRNNLWGGLAVLQTVGPSGHTNSPHPSSREGHLSTARWNSSFLLSGLILNGFHAAATTCSRVQKLINHWFVVAERSKQARTNFSWSERQTRIPDRD